MADHDVSNKKNHDKVSGSMEKMRMLILGFVLLLIGGVGYPWFLMTTEIHRAELPVDEINSLSESVTDNIHFKIPVYLDLANSKEDFIASTQEYLNTKLYNQYPALKDTWGIDLKRGINMDEIDSSKDYVIRFEILPDSDNDEIEINSAYSISPFTKEIKFTLTNNVILSNNVGDFITNVLLGEVFSVEIERFNNYLTGKSYKNNEQNLIVPYASHYNLIISLFIEDGTPVEWEVEKALNLLTPVLNGLKHIAKFSISTQVQYYSALNVEPEIHKDYNLIKLSDLSTFVNYGDWNLNNNDIDPTINFLVYFPNSNYQPKPLLIENSHTNSFIIPQWGGVFIYNKEFDVKDDNDHFVITEVELIKILEIFTSQLFKLLGAPNSPKSNAMRIDSLTRLSTYKNLIDSLNGLQSLIKLTDSLSEISIPELTKSFAETSLDMIKSTFDNINNHNFHLAMVSSAKGLFNANKAFFEKEIVQQVYFPSEHKLAVFLPLVGPIGSILLMTTIKQIKQLKQKKKNHQ